MTLSDIYNRPFYTSFQNLDFGCDETWYESVTNIWPAFVTKIYQWNE